jgi:hypothetical protein
VLTPRNSTKVAGATSVGVTSAKQSPGERAISNSAFLRSVGIALVVLATSALILTALILAFYPQAGSSNASDKTICGIRFSVISGSAEKTSGGPVLTGLDPDGHAMLSCPIRADTKDYAFIQYTITGRSAGQKIFLWWRTREDPDALSDTELHWNGTGPTTINLGNNEAWQGHITELVVEVFGDLRGRPLAFVELELKPYSRGAVLSTIWSDWVTFRGWTQKSINSLTGVQDGSFISPTVSMASWLALSVLLWAAIYLKIRSHNPIGYATSLLVPWFALDMLWQLELSTQLDETRTLFADKTQQEKHQADRDGELYSYATYLKEQVLPKPGAKIVLLHDSEPADYRRLKAQFYLFPHNTFNFLRFPPAGEPLEAEYIWALGEIEGLGFSPKTNTLQWQDNELAVQRVDVHPLGALYRIARSAQ